MNTSDTRRRTGGRSARVRQAVLDATVAALAEEGIESVSVAGVAARAGVHETSIYRRWKTREGLIVAALLAHSEQTLPVPDTGSLRQDLSAFARAVAHMTASPLGAALVRAMATTDDSPEIAQSRAEFWQARLDTVRAIIDRAAARGELTTVFAPRLVLETLIAPVHFHALMTREPLDDHYPDQLIDLLLQGLQPHQP
ncbi:TetR/AcrR family transcriptional regulator [Streptomyces sp. NBC_00996]|uniref:TetR/AcrR family transcriptional regulator n=1 Tax=Streptomyces sp. NBC_00996 TaxID=2903710 RepID=UPI00387038A6|nr:TetR/AcrR family transcriptional regulator [Streptomyces sp. NBC_00996]